MNYKTITPNLFTTLIRKSRGQSNHIGCLENTLPERIPNLFADFFSSVFNDNTHPIPDFALQVLPLRVMPMLNITVEGLTNLIKKLDIRKASGPDEISSYCIKEFSKNVRKFLSCPTLVMQASLDHNSVPQD